MYPEYAEINGQKYKIDTDYRTALKCFKIIDDDEITDYERCLAVIYLLFDFVPTENIEIFMQKVKKFLEYSPTYKTKKNTKKSIDFEKDRSFINASIMSDYHIDVTKEKIHFWYFIELIEGLSDNCILSKIIEIRNCDLNKIKDKETKKRIKEAKEIFDLKEEKKPTKEQEKSMDELQKIIGIRKE